MSEEIQRNGEKSWNEQFREWAKSKGMGQRILARTLGMPKTSVADYLNGRIKNLDKISHDNKYKLYQTTGLKCFECGAPSTPRIEIGEPKRKEENRPAEYSNEAPLGKEVHGILNALHGTIDSLIENLDGRTRMREGVLKAQRYQPSAAQRADAIVELVELLGSEIDYFRTAPENERLVLTGRLKENSDSIGYATQMLNVIYNGSGMDSWMLLAQPPARIRKAFEKGRKGGGK